MSSGGGSKLASALSEAQSIIEAAEKRAAELTRDAESAYKKSQELGYKDGYRAGQEEVARKALRLITESAGVSEKLAEEASKLALAICENIVGDHLKMEPQAIRRIAMTALQQSVIGESALIVVHPEDRETLLSSLPDLRRAAGGATVSVESDADLARGSCLVRTDFGEVDASLPALLGAIASQLGIDRK